MQLLDLSIMVMDRIWNWKCSHHQCLQGSKQAINNMMDQLKEYVDDCICHHQKFLLGHPIGVSKYALSIWSASAPYYRASQKQKSLMGALDTNGYHYPPDTHTPTHCGNSIWLQILLIYVQKRGISKPPSGFQLLTMKHLERHFKAQISVISASFSTVCKCCHDG